MRQIFAELDAPRVVRTLLSAHLRNIKKAGKSARSTRVNNYPRCRRDLAAEAAAGALPAGFFFPSI